MHQPTLLLKSLFTAFALFAVVAFAHTEARATPVTYSTSGSFNGGGNSFTFTSGIGNTTTITFTGVSSTVLANPSTFASLGEFQTMVSGTGGAIPSGTTFSLVITQTAPSGGTGSFSAILSGTLTQDSSTGIVTFSVSSVNINGVTYALSNNPLPLVPPNTNNGVTTVQAQISTVPEPATMLLLGTGLAGVAASARRRRSHDKE